MNPVLSSSSASPTASSSSLLASALRQEMIGRYNKHFLHDNRRHPLYLPGDDKEAMRHGVVVQDEKILATSSKLRYAVQPGPHLKVVQATQTAVAPFLAEAQTYSLPVETGRLVEFRRGKRVVVMKAEKYSRR